MATHKRVLVCGSANVIKKSEDEYVDKLFFTIIR